MRISLLSLLLFLFVGFACTAPATEDQETAAEVSEEIQEETEIAESDAALAKGDNYATELLEGGIPSPRKEMTGTIGDVTVTVNYGSPSVKGREIWGGLEEYDKVWRAGANAPTTIEFSSDVMIEGKALEAGKYTLLTIPSEGQWTIIFTVDGQSAFNYDDSKDVLRVMVDAAPLSTNVEELQYVIEGEAVALQWEKLSVPFAVAAS